jgi:hypothetical protein
MTSTCLDATDDLGVAIPGRGKTMRDWSSSGSKGNGYEF